MADAATLKKKIQDNVPAVAAATTQTTTIAEAPFDSTITDVTFTPSAAITGATATKRTFTVVNKGQSGAGTTVVATLDLITGVNPPAFDETAFTLSVVANATVCAKGDIIAVAEAVTSTGTANPGGLIQIEFTRST